MANLTPQEKEMKEGKCQAITDKLEARNQIRARLIANHENDLTKIDAEIAELELSKKAYDGLK